MDQPLGVRGLERRSDLAVDRDRARRIQRALLQQRAQILTANQPHVDIQRSVNFTPIMDRMT